MKGTAIFLLLGCALAALPVGHAVAGNVYRCESGDGSTTYSNKRVDGNRCKLVGRYKVQRAMPGTRARRAPATPSAVATGSAPGSMPAISAPARASAQSIAPPPVAGAPRRVRGQVYSYVKDGIRTYTSAPPKGGAGISGLRTIKYSYLEACYACGARPGVSFATVRLNTAAYQAEIAAAAREQGVEEAIVRAIIHAESAFNPNALSRVGAQGLMQLMPATARRFGVSDAFDASQNISGGVKYLAWLLKRFDGNLALAAAGYNAGEGAVDKYRGVPPYTETRRYVERVGVLAQRYRSTLAR